MIHNILHPMCRQNINTPYVHSVCNSQLYHDGTEFYCERSTCEFNKWLLESEQNLNNCSCEQEHLTSYHMCFLMKATK